MNSMTSSNLEDERGKCAMLNCYHAHADNSPAHSEDYIQKKKLRRKWELIDGQLTCYEEDRPCLSTRAVRVERRKGSNIIIVECGIGGLLLLFLEFDSRDDADLWEKELCTFTGQKYQPRPGVRRKGTFVVTQSPRMKERPSRTKSTLPHTFITENHIEPTSNVISRSGEDQVEQDGEDATDNITEHDTCSPSTDQIAVAPLEDATGLYSPLGTDSASDINDEDELDDTTSTELYYQSSYSSESSLDRAIAEYKRLLGDAACELLKERDMVSVEMEYAVMDIKKSEFELADYKQRVYVTWLTTGGANINVYDVIEIKNKEGQTMNAGAVANLIRSTTEEKISICVERIPEGIVCRLNVQSFQELGITLHGSEIINMSVMDAVRQACDPMWTWFADERSLRSITTINNEPVPFGASTEKVEMMLEEAIIQDSGYLVLHLHPTSFLRIFAPPDDKRNQGDHPASS